MTTLQNFISQTVPNSISGKYAPFLIFLAVYILTCVAGAALTLIGYRPYTELVELFSGTVPPVLTGGQLLTNVLLLFVSPFLMYCGYVAGLFISNRINLSPRRQSISSSNLPANLAVLMSSTVFYTLAAIALINIYEAGTLGDLGRWLDYGYWVKARYQLFSALSFFSFTNIYIFVPLAAAWVLISRRPKTKAQHVFRWMPTIITIVIGLLVFQKKTVVISMLLIIIAWALWRVSTHQIKNLGKLVVLAGSMIVLVYFVLVVLPIYSRTSHTLAEALNIEAPPTSPAQTTRKRLAHLAHSFDIHDQDTRVFLYAVMAPLSRTSIPALYYPVVFPEHHPFYGLYFGQNFLRLGKVPDDNIVVWDYMNPGIPGATAAPFQFAFYSQLGLIGALIASGIVGLGLAILWTLTRSGGVSEPWRSLLGSLTMLAAIYLALDSLHNEIIASYGVSWGLLFVAAAWLSTLGMKRIIPSSRIRAEQS